MNYVDKQAIGAVFANQGFLHLHSSGVKTLFSHLICARFSSYNQ